MSDEIPPGLPTPDEMQAAYRVLRWLTFNYLVPPTDTWMGLVEGTRCLCVCAYELHDLDLSAADDSNAARNED